MVVELEFCDAQKPSSEIRADFIGRKFGEGHEKGFLGQILRILQVVDPGRQVSADQQPVLMSKQAETILLTPSTCSTMESGSKFSGPLFITFRICSANHRSYEILLGNKDNLFGSKSTSNRFDADSRLNLG